MKVIVTGGAGFIGSCVIRTLNDMGIEDITIVDHICDTDKWMNMRNKKYIEYIQRDKFLKNIQNYSGKVTHIIHLGACSATTERNFDFLYENNYEYSKILWKFSVENNISFIYASSAATYGDGQQGFDDRESIEKLRPLNGYGYSKQLFDLWVNKQNIVPKQHVGFKFFNVYGPNEYFKGNMASVIFHAYKKITEIGEMALFKSYKDNYEDGGQLRDFVYVKDICKVIKFVIEHDEINGLFNLGTGVARSFYDLALSTFKAQNLAPNIKFIDMPAPLKLKYQYYTQAKMEKLKSVGYKEKFYTLEEGILDYVQNYLMKDYKIY